MQRGDLMGAQILSMLKVLGVLREVILSRGVVVVSKVLCRSAAVSATRLGSTTVFDANRWLMLVNLGCQFANGRSGLVHQWIF